MKLVKCLSCGAPLAFSRCDYCGARHDGSSAPAVKSVPQDNRVFFEGREITDPREKYNLRIQYGRLLMWSPQ